MSTEIKLPEGAPEEVVTNALVRDVDLTPFGFAGSLALITLDNGLDHTRPNTFGPQSLQALDAASPMRLVVPLRQSQLPESHLSLPPVPIYQLFHSSQSVRSHLRSESLDTMFFDASMNVGFLPLHLSMG